MSVTVVSCVYGDQYARFTTQWAAAIQALDPKPDAVIVAADDLHDIPGATVYPSTCNWKYPQSYYLNEAVEWAETDWVWIVDIDDIAMHDGLKGLEDVAADVWQLGYERSDGEIYTPPRLSANEFLHSDKCVYVAGSMIRVDAYRSCGGFPDVALQDWGLWRRLAVNGASVEPSYRPHFYYVRHLLTRGVTELTMSVRAKHMAEMWEDEHAHA